MHHSSTELKILPDHPMATPVLDDQIDASTNLPQNPFAAQTQKNDKQ
jgi:hypothetical protein